ncbi:class I SAM-dependent methyltransferase [Microbaculum marinum]|uniref:Methyltransferase domain-containing protein n=1 Tax=Microbaculum marinum TaxID=1764581 RepID=A0AAW9RZI0_9HYPH
MLFLFSHRFLALARWDIHFLAVRLRNVLTGQDGRIRRFLDTRQRPTFLNLGSGPRGLEEGNWVNIDGYRDHNVHFCIDFSRRLPFADATFDGIFCEHVVEHFSLEQGRELLREIHRILRPGGWARIIVPDGAVVMRAYFDDPERLIAHRGQRDRTAMQVVNDYFRQRYEHQFLYDWETMERMLSEAGFDRVCRCSFGEGRGPAALRIDDRKYAWESLYAEARTPLQPAAPGQPGHEPAPLHKR